MIPEKRILFLLYKVAILILHRSSHKYSNGQGEKGKGSGGRGGGGVLIPSLGATRNVVLR